MIRTLIRPTLFHHHSIKYSSSLLKIVKCSYASIQLDPYVSNKYSYAFGRGTIPLLNENINYFLNIMKQQPQSELLISHHEKKRITNHEFVEDVRRMASGLYNNLRLRKGDTICLWSLNCYDWLKICFACQSIGVTVCTVNPYYKEHELAFALIKCKAKVVFLPGSESPQNSINQFLKIFNSDYVQNELKNKGHIRSVVFIDENKDQTAFELETYRLQQLDLDPQLDDKILESVEGDDPAVIMYTSGTTGEPKGVVLSNFSIINNATVSGDYFVSEPDDCTILPLPLFHSFALTCGAQVMACKAVKTVLTGYRYNTKDVVEAILENNGTFLMATPTMVIDIVDYVRKKNIQLPSLRTIILDQTKTVSIGH